MRIALGVEYDGSGYSGWQTQPHGVTIQDKLESALSQVANHPVGLVCAGRTDAGVHAVGQIAHFDSDAQRTARAWQLGVNACLPSDISVSWAVPVKDQFHARFSATERSYRYVILNRHYSSALLHRRVHFEPRNLNVDAMSEAASALLGEHDFTSFRAASCQAHSPLRTVCQLQVVRHGQFVVIDIAANAFLQNMVRIIVGALLRVGRQEETIPWLSEILVSRNRQHLGVTAPAGGLYLRTVQYPAEFALPRVTSHPVLPFLE